MPKNYVPKPSPQICKHATLRLHPSPHAAIVGYKQPSTQQRTAAAILSGHVKDAQDIKAVDPGIFPAPLVLPDDDLALDPKYPAQSFRSWLHGKYRNKVTPERRTIYIARSPDVDPEVEFVRGWGRPRITARKGKEGDDANVSPPDVDTVVRYLEVFYHGFPVRLLPPSYLKFAAWDDDEACLKPGPKRAKPSQASATSKAPIPTHIALQTSAESIRIRARARPTTAAFPAQLNLDDVLEVAITVLPVDAYALLLLVEQDLYEDEDDEFVCGRAYGGSRVAVVSTARYHPALDTLQVDRQHAWPGSHCEEYIAECCATTATAARATGQRWFGKSQVRDAVESGMDSSNPKDTAPISPMHAAISAHISLSPLFDPNTLSPVAQSHLWLSRVCKTASHELGHCCGIDHCIYYACIMQGSASMPEDLRQPPYLCPVEEAKLSWAVAELNGKTAKGAVGEEWREKWVRERREMLMEFCEDMGRDTGLWKSYGAWLGQLEGRGVDEYEELGL